MAGGAAASTENAPMTREEISTDYVLVRDLLQYILRMFYDTRQVVLVDRLIRAVPFV